jgi:hypothetical protein
VVRGYLSARVMPGTPRLTLLRLWGRLLIWASLSSAVNYVVDIR